MPDATTELEQIRLKIEQKDDFLAQFLYAAKNNHIQRAQRLLADGKFDPSVDDNSTLVWACENGISEVVKVLLLDSRVDPTVREGYCLSEACFLGHVEVVRLLLQDGRIEPTLNNSLCLFNACLQGHIDVITLLLNDGRVVVEDTNEDGVNCLEIAVLNNDDDVVKLLLEHQKAESLAASLAGSRKGSKLNHKQSGLSQASNVSFNAPRPNSPEKHDEKKAAVEVVLEEPEPSNDSPKPVLASLQQPSLQPEPIPDLQQNIPTSTETMVRTIPTSALEYQLLLKTVNVRDRVSKQEFQVIMRSLQAMSNMNNWRIENTAFNILIKSLLSTPTLSKSVSDFNLTGNAVKIKVGKEVHPNRGTLAESLQILLDFAHKMGEFRVNQDIVDLFKEKDDFKSRFRAMFKGKKMGTVLEEFNAQKGKWKR